MMAPRKKARYQTASIAAPVGGLNARDALANMPKEDAIILDNWFPTPSDVELRNGYMQHSTGLPGWVETIFPYNGLTGSGKLFGASVAGIYDCSSPGAVGAAVVTGLANTRFQHVAFSTAGANYVYGVNGADNPVLYNGTAWQQVSNISAPIAITGVDPSTFISVNIFKQRLFFIPKNSTLFWYLNATSVGGVAQSFDLGPLLRLGGYLMGMVTWTIDNSQGLQEYACFVSSEGEVIVYQGYDPNTTATWAQVAQFRIGRPIGRRFYAKNGSDIILLTMDGAVPLSESLLTDRSQSKIAVSDKIRNLINNDVASYGNNFGWQCLLSPLGNKIIVNVPVIENSLQYQYVMNTITGNWCTFGKLNSPWLAACFELWEDNLYFGGNTYLAQCDTGQTDNNGNIQATGKQAFSYFGERGTNKLFTLVRPILIANGSLQAAIDLNVNFEDRVPTSSPTFSSGAGSPWNTSPWNTSPWTSGNNVIQDWDTPNAIGFCASVYMKVTAANLGVSWQSTDFAYQQGGVL